MKYVFFGSPRFASIVLEELIAAGMPPAALVCNPDRPVGRKKVVTPPATKQLIADRGLTIPVLQPEKIDDAFLASYKEIAPELAVVAAYAQIIPMSALDVPELGTLGVHPSLLPKYRGSSPIQSAILAGEKETGVSIYLMDAKMDHGPVLVEEKLAFDPLTTDYEALEEKLAHIGGRLVARAIPEFKGDTLEPTPQDETGATYTKKFSTQDGFIDKKDLEAAEKGDASKAEVIVRTINALSIEPGAWTTRDGKRIKLLEAGIKDGTLELRLTQKEGEKPKRA